MEIHGIDTSYICYCEARGLSNCFNAYAEYAPGEDIMENGIGFNSSSGYTYIALENGINICSCLGRDVEYLYTTEDGYEHFFDTYEDAEKFKEELYNIDNIY